jgi:TRAP-type C4-dicarboxylate transport system permease small subunit
MLLAAADRVAAGIALAAAWLAAAIMAGFCGLILLEVLLRSFFGQSTQILEEYVGYGLGTMVFLGLGHTLREGALVRVDLLIGALSPAVRRAFEIAICAVTLVVVGFVIHAFSVGVGRNLRNGTISMTPAATPLWVPEGLVLLGMVLFALQLIVYLVRLCAGGPVIRDTGRVD